MSIELLLYLIDIAGNLSVALGIVIVASLIALLISTIILAVCFGETNDDFKESKLFFLYNSIWSHIGKIIVVLILAILCPSQKTMYMIVGAHYLKASTLPSKVELAIEKKIDEYLIETKK